MLANGKPVRDAKTWNEKRRAEIVRLFEENQYGRSPGRPAAMSFDVFDKGTPALDGKAIRRQVTIYFSADKAGPKMDLLVYVPANATGPVPAAAESGLLRQFQHGQRPWRQSRRGLGPGQEEGTRRPGNELRQGRTWRACWMPASASPRSTTATSIPISWAACPMACERSI